MQNANIIEKFDLMQDETFNTKILGWLLNPKENHNCGSAFLEDFLFLINEKVNLSNDITVEIGHDTVYYGNIDILLKTKESIYAIKCGNMTSFDSYGNVFSYKDYITKHLKSDKKVTVIFIGVTPSVIDEKKLDYIKVVGYSEIAEILPENLANDNQKIIDYYSNIIQEKSAKCVCPTCDNEYITKWKELHKHGKIVRKIAKYFNLNFTYKLFNANFRRYVVNINKEFYLIFSCEDNNLYIQIRKTDSVKPLEREVVANINTQNIENIITTIEQSNILKNYHELFNMYD